MDRKKLDEIKKLVKSLDCTPAHSNIHIIGMCEECGFPGIENDPFAPHSKECSKNV